MIAVTAFVIAIGGVGTAAVVALYGERRRARAAAMRRHPAGKGKGTRAA